MSRRRPLHRAVGLYLGALALASFSAGPFVWMALTSIKADSEILRPTPVLWPADPSLDRYGQVLRAGFGRALLSSVVVAGATTLAAVAIAALAAYALTRLAVPLRRYLVLTVMTVQMFPLVVLLIPLYTVMGTLGLLNSYLGLVLAYLSFTTPLAIWVLKGFLEGIPVDLEEAAMTDGATRLRAMTRVVLPLARPGLAATAVLSFVAAWNEFLLALTFVKDERLATLPVALSRFVGLFQADWGLVMAGGVLFTAPVVVFFLLLHRRLVEGMLAGSVKG